jgi:hypothetical protein
VNPIKKKTVKLKTFKMICNGLLNQASPGIPKAFPRIAVKLQGCKAAAVRDLLNTTYNSVNA